MDFVNKKLDEFENLYLKYLNEKKLPNSLFDLFENLITTLFRLCYKDNQKTLSFSKFF